MSNEIKLILATLLLEYDLKLSGDRPDTIISDTTVRPDSQKCLFGAGLRQLVFSNSMHGEDM